MVLRDYNSKSNKELNMGPHIDTKRAHELKVEKTKEIEMSRGLIVQGNMRLIVCKNNVH